MLSKTEKKRREEALKVQRRKAVEYSRIWQRKNATKVARQLKAQRDQVRLEALVVYGGKCAFCAEPVQEYLVLDHINGKVEHTSGGARISGGSLYSHLRSKGWPRGEHRWLCSNCNMARAVYGDKRARALGRQKRKDRKELQQYRVLHGSLQQLQLVKAQKKEA